MFDILANFHRTKDWALALEEIIPKRKGVHKKDGDSSDEGDAPRDQRSVNESAPQDNNTNTM